MYFINKSYIEFLNQDKSFGVYIFQVLFLLTFISIDLFRSTRMFCKSIRFEETIRCDRVQDG